MAGPPATVRGVLSVLRIKNFVLIDELELELEPGLNVLTGETGAGKSIVVGALNLVLGGRASADQVRPGAEEAEIEALFLLERPGATASLAHAELRPALTRLRDAGVVTGDELAIRRVVTASGRSRAYLNGRLCTAAELAALAPELADVASQHESVALTDPSTHLGYLDRFARLERQRSKLADGFDELERIVGAIRALREVDKSRAEREAFLRFQLQGIAEVAPRAGELDELADERRRLRHAGKLSELVGRVAERLEAEQGIADQLARAAGELGSASELDPTLEPLLRSLEAARSELVDVAAECARYAENIEGNPDRLSEVEERLYRLEQLLRQHGPTLDDLLLAQARIESELAPLDRSDAQLALEEAALAARLPEIGAMARELSRERKQAAEALGAAIGRELGALGMGGARVLVEVEPMPSRDPALALSVDGARLSREGIDRVEFLISPNKGIDPRPLRKIASGGELSRALLALKRVLAGSGPAGLYVFDEVDTGVGGAVADAIGRAIADVARHDQVLCITHLAPIASFSQSHYVVRKSLEGERTRSLVERVEGEQRTQEVARMLSGAKVTSASLEAAREMIADAQRSLEGASERRAATRDAPSTASVTARKPGTELHGKSAGRSAKKAERSNER